VSTEALRAAIESEGRARIVAILRSAEEEARRLRDEASSRARQRQSDALRDEEVELRREASARIAAARADARKQVLEAREDLLDRVFAMAEEALSVAFEAPSARGELVARAERALSHMPPGGAVVVSCSSGVAPMLESALASHDDVCVECDPDLPAGILVAAAEGAVVVDATLSRLLEADRPALAIEILRRLEGNRDEEA
jgi:vacuolar-type H+-ATPase subunit E/Vma4